jgi:endonuclease/exonuclease/phosphatase family metal-dependent hydrolase
MGDFNEWLPWGRPLRWLHAYFGKVPTPASFPSQLPLFALDRIWVHPAEALVSTTPHRTTLARRASDHLPVVARVTWPAVWWGTVADRCCIRGPVLSRERWR